MLKQNIVLPDLFTSKELEVISRKDAKILALPKDIERYVASNRDKYSVLLNTWMYMCSQYCTSRAVNALMSAIRLNGLVPVISECSSLASDIIRSDFTLSDLGHYYYLMNEDPRITLQLLRYPKRFSPCNATRLRDEGLQAFITLNRSLRGIPCKIDLQGRVLERHQEYPRFLINLVKDWCSRLLNERKFTKPVTDDDLLVAGRFSNGVSALGSSTLYQKYTEWSRLTPGYKDTFLYPLWRFGNHFLGEIDDINYVKAVAVPKSYKAPRIIAEVSAKCQYYQQGIRELLLKRLSTTKYAHLILLDDQTINQEWARLGSIYSTFATIDLSSASDSISNHLAKQVLPSWLYDVIQRYNPDYIKVGDKMEKRNILLTSGSGDTFVVESLLFLSIALAAWEYVTVITAEKLEYPRVYGDDLICDTRCFDTLCDFLSLLGFSVNEEKSFNSGNYRESCGTEWFCGLDTATKYFPRRAYDEDSAEYLEGLIALQHRLYEYENCEQWLSNHVRSLYRAYTHGKELTSSYPGTECSDLWADYPFYYNVYPPYNRETMSEETRVFLDTHGIKREAHSAIKRKSLSDKEVSKAFQAKYHRPYTWEQELMMDMFRYVDFLQHGMQYDEYGIPIHRADVSDDLLDAVVVWTTTIR